MASVKISHVLSYSSEDNKYPAKNLQEPGRANGGWLCSGDDARKGRCEVTLQLLTHCIISNIDIGNNGSFTIEVQVCQCGSNEFVSLIPATMFMTPSESRLSKNRTSIKMFKTGDFCANLRDRKYDRLRLICSQPHRRDKGFGISLIRVVADEQLEQMSSTSSSTASPSATCKSMLDLSEPNTPTAGDNKMSDAAGWFHGALKQKLDRISSTAQKSQYSSRNVQMVMKAIGQPQHKTPLTEHIMNSVTTSTAASAPAGLPNRQATPPTFMMLVKQFYKGLDLSAIDPYTMRVSELRHQFEKQRCRKLNSDEKKLFKAYALQYFQSRVENPEETTANTQAIHVLENRTPVSRAKSNPVRMSSAKDIKLANELSQRLLTGIVTPPVNVSSDSALSAADVTAAGKGPSVTPMAAVLTSASTVKQSQAITAAVSSPNAIGSTPICRAASTTKTLAIRSPRLQRSQTVSRKATSSVTTTASSIAPSPSTRVSMCTSEAIQQPATTMNSATPTITSLIPKPSPTISTVSTPLIPTLNRSTVSTPPVAPSFRQGLSASGSERPQRCKPSAARRPVSQQDTTQCQSLRMEVLPSSKKRDLSELLSDDDDDLMLPVGGGADPTFSSSTPKRSCRATSNTEQQRSAHKQQHLSAADLLSSDSEGEGAPARTLPTESSFRSCPSDVVVLSEDDDLPDLSCPDLPQASAEKVEVTQHVRMPMTTTIADDLHPNYDVNAIESRIHQIRDDIKAFEESMYGQTQVFTCTQSKGRVSDRPNPSADALLIQCPICMCYFSSDIIESHASDCIIE